MYEALRSRVAVTRRANKALVEENWQLRSELNALQSTTSYTSSRPDLLGKEFNEYFEKISRLEGELAREKVSSATPVPIERSHLSRRVLVKH